MAKISTRKRGKTWSYSFEAGPTMDGRRKRYEKGGFATEKEALVEGAKRVSAFLQGERSITSEKITVRDFIQKWLERKKMDVRPGTLASYRTIAARVVPLIGNKYVQDVDDMDIEETIQDLARKGLSHGTLSITRNMLKNVFDYAIRPCRLISANPAQGIKIPRNAPRKVVERMIVRKEKMDELLNAYPFGHSLHVPILIAYHTGMRMGEVLGLAWDCVDLAKASVRVKRQFAYASDVGRYFGPPKTTTSTREIPIGEELVSLLKRWKAQQAANEMQHGKAYFYIYEAKNGGVWQMHKQAKPEKGMVRRAIICTREDGRLISVSTFAHALQIHGLNSHSLRHTHATVCAENGAPAKGIAGRLGHSNTALTENLYTHETDSIKADTLQAFEKSAVKQVP